MPFEDVVIAGHGAAVQRLPLGEGEPPKSTLRLIGNATRDALSMAQIELHQIDCVLTHRPPAADGFSQFAQKLVAEMKIAPTSVTAMTNHGAGMLSALKYGALLLERGLARYVLCPSGDAAATSVMDSQGANAAVEADAHFERPYRPVTPALFGQIGQRFVYEYGITEEDLAQVCVDLRETALSHPEAEMRSKGPLTLEQVISSPMIATPSRLFHCAPWHRGSRAGSVILSRSADAPDRAGGHIHLRAVGETVTHEHISSRLGLRRFGRRGRGPDLTVTGAYAAARQAYEFAGFGADSIDVLASPVPFAFAVLMLLEDLGMCERGGSAEFVRSGGLRASAMPTGPAILTNGGSLSFGQSYLNCAMDQLLEAVQQLEGSALGVIAHDATRALVHSHGGVLAVNTVALLERA